jgi:alkylation response protein AidB-like acyl-CoA dehydrogenase
MDLRFTSNELALRDELLEIFRSIIPSEIRHRVIAGHHLSKAEVVESQRLLNSHSLAVPHWPVECGGRGWNAVQIYLYREALHLAGVPEPQPQTVDFIGPVICEFGNDEQKRYFLPRFANLDIWCCQGFSEPNAGSDLASLRTVARRDGDHYVVNGQKMWTSHAHWADWVFCLVRTASTPRPQAGITLLMIDLASPGVTIRPVITIDRRHTTNEVFLDNVRVPVANRIGEENKGWDYAKFVLSHERFKLARIGVATRQIARAKELVATVPSSPEPYGDNTLFREKVALLEVELKALEMTTMRMLSAAMQRADNKLDPSTALLKLRSSELLQSTAEMLAEIAGPEALEYRPDEEGAASEPGEVSANDDWVSPAVASYLHSRVFSITAGSNEIQRNIIAKAVLGL